MSISKNSGVEVAGYPATAESAGHARTVSRGGSAAVLERLLQDRLALLGLVIILVVVAVAIFAPYIAPNDPVKVDLQHRLAPPSAQYPLGTDHLGRCLLSRLIYGARVSLSTAVLALSAILLIGLPVGILAGYCGGWVDNLFMRLVDIMLAFPGLILALVIAGMLGPGLLNVMLALALVWWVGYARVVRGMVLSVKEKEFILAARACGTSECGIIIRHILPNIISPVIVLTTLDMGKLILAISGLSFLGLGAQPPTPEWGAMLNDGRPYMQVAPQLMIYPGLCIMTVVLAFNLLGDGLRDVLDSRITTGVKEV
ncbi:dipeptide transport system permease protein DppC [Thermoanaerobacter kivui]|uniref:Dipeptide transport system permease protein DppC n=1 Tax=Thermoanaerobacter kivui TaxID=2325 RepID=A0A097AQX9_THEKI|nr:nickel ABC transporter permease subunit NikC [Thermoanaerobacter kivui]AIS52198.1 dipeptide transport system permease protein DppC [Thermoanaerobacter kivui]